MKLTQQFKIEHFDAVATERDKLRLAVYDLTCSTKFPFVDRVNVKGEDIDGNYKDCKFRVSVSRRPSMPIYMVEQFGHDGSVAGVDFWWESECADHADDSRIYWRMFRHAVWLQEQLRKKIT